MPERIQLKRTKGWRKPEGAIVVARPSKWGNPFAVRKVGPFYEILFNEALTGSIYATIEEARSDAVDFYIMWLYEKTHAAMGHRDAKSELRGHDLACWCPLDQPCHADVLLDLVNA